MCLLWNDDSVMVDCCCIYGTGSGNGMTGSAQIDGVEGPMVYLVGKLQEAEIKASRAETRADEVAAAAREESQKTKHQIQKAIEETEKAKEETRKAKEDTQEALKQAKQERVETRGERMRSLAFQYEISKCAAHDQVRMIHCV